MSTTCRSCTAPSDLFLCNRCIGELRTLLGELPWWLERLGEEAVGDVHKSDGGKSSTRREPFVGEDHPLSPCTCGHYTEGRWVNHRGHMMIACREVDPGTGDKCTCDEYRPVVPQSRLRAQLLAAGRVNARASDLLDEVRSTIATMVRHLGESHGLTYVRVTFIGPLKIGHVRLATDTPSLLGFLHSHAQALASDEGAGVDLRELKKHQRSIERLVDRPVPQRYAGPCPTTVTDKTTGRQRECGTRLMAPLGALRVRCPACKAEHDLERIINRLLANVEHWRFTREELIGSPRSDWDGIMGLLEEPVSRQTFSRWCKPGPKGERPELRISGYRRPDGSVGISRRTEEDQPLYRLNKVRRLRADMATKQRLAMGWSR